MKDTANINSRFDDGMYGVVQHPGYNSRSYTTKEMETLGELRKFKLFKQLNREELVLKNKPENKYYIIENGIVFKFNKETLKFYRLNLTDFVWENAQQLSSIYYNSYSKFQELTSFEDYYSEN